MSSEGSLNDGVVAQWDSAAVNLSVSSLVDEIVNDLSGRISISDIWFDSPHHVDCGSVQSDKDSVVDLT